MVYTEVFTSAYFISKQKFHGVSVCLEIALDIRALAALTEEPDSVPSTHMAAHK